MQNHNRQLLVLLLLLPLLLFVLPIVAAAAVATNANASHPVLVEDRWGPISTPVPRAAIEKFEAAVVGYASLRGEVVAPLEQAIALAPSYFLAHVYLGSILLLSTAVTKDHPLVQRSYAAARDLAASNNELTDRESGHWWAFQALHDAGPAPDFTAAAAAWEAVLDAHPRDLLAIRSAHDAYIILGDTANLRASLARVLSRDWGVGDGNAGAVAARETDRRYAVAMWAFALEENGDYARAAAVARGVLAEDPTDVTALHALVHTVEMVSQKRAGEAIYQEFEGKWEGLEHSLFINHVAWHRALFDLYLEGDKGAERALALYDAFLVRGDSGPATPLAMADAASLLWRLMLHGVDPGRERWAALRRFYAEGGYGTAHVTSFNDVHMLLCLAVADPPAAHKALASMRDFAAFGGKGGVRWWLRWNWQQFLNVSYKRKPGPVAHRTTAELYPTNVRVLREVGLAVGEAILAFAEGRYAHTVELLRGSRDRWILIGGSHAQRDVLMLLLIEACLREGTDLSLARALLAERASIKDPDSEEGTWERLRAVEARVVEVEQRGKGEGMGREEL